VGANTGTAGDDAMTGGGGMDGFYGMGGNDTISGGSGNDLIDGGGGTDRMTGGAGSDIFDWFCQHSREPSHLVRDGGPGRLPAGGAGTRGWSASAAVRPR
jgi:RTX calcium-binding nonapeptide repeat (4 copies)